MPKKKKKTTLTRRQRQVLAKVEKLQKAHKELQLGLKNVEKLLSSPLSHPFGPLC
jgi:cell fate (sporulation/competence/biofilm development) regulator YlbF (YheA/YmcA/DUF963 family)